MNRNLLITILFSSALLMSGCTGHIIKTDMIYNGGDAPPFYKFNSTSSINPKDTIVIFDGTVKESIATNEVVIEVYDKTKYLPSKKQNNNTPAKSQSNSDTKSREVKESKKNPPSKNAGKTNSQQKDEKKSMPAQERQKGPSKQQARKKHAKKPAPPKFSVVKQIRNQNGDWSTSKWIKRWKDPLEAEFRILVVSEQKKGFTGDITIVDHLDPRFRMDSLPKVSRIEDNRESKKALEFLPILGGMISMAIDDFDEAGTLKGHKWTRNEQLLKLHFNNITLNDNEGVQVAFKTDIVLDALKDDNKGRQNNYDTEPNTISSTTKPKTPLKEVAVEKPSTIKKAKTPTTIKLPEKTVTAPKHKTTKQPELHAATKSSTQPVPVEKHTAAPVPLPPTKKKDSPLYKTDKKMDSRPSVAPRPNPKHSTKAQIAVKITAVPASTTPKTQQTARHYLNNGLKFRAKDDFASAVAEYDKALAITPNNPRILEIKGYALFRLGRHSEAFAALDKAYRLSPTRVNTVINKIKVSCAIGTTDQLKTEIKASQETISNNIQIFFNDTELQKTCGDKFKMIKDLQ